MSSTQSVVTFHEPSEIDELKNEIQTLKDYIKNIPKLWITNIYAPSEVDRIDIIIDGRIRILYDDKILNYDKLEGNVYFTIKTKILAIVNFTNQKACINGVFKFIKFIQFDRLALFGDITDMKDIINTTKPLSFHNCKLMFDANDFINKDEVSFQKCDYTPNLLKTHFEQPIENGFIKFTKK